MHLALTDMIFRWAPDTLAQSLLMTLKGMIGIFAVILVVWLFVAILNRVTKTKAEKEDK